MASHASAKRELSAVNNRAANAQRAGAEVNRVHAVESDQDRMVIGAHAVGNAPVRMENAVNVAANVAAVVDAQAGDVAVSVAAASRPKNIVSC